jgi:hypothetical protein
MRRGWVLLLCALALSVVLGQPALEADDGLPIAFTETDECVGLVPHQPTDITRGTIQANIVVALDGVSVAAAKKLVAKAATAYGPGVVPQLTPDVKINVIAYHDLTGKLKHKANTFTDFIACAEHLIETGWTSADRLAILGGSAGGLLVGATLNLRPDLFRAAVAEVPFVDVVSTISDPTLPLSVIEWEEWGNPAEPEFYEVMKSYSPYDNVRPVRYPDLFVTAGLNDPRVSYWEPAKWVAKLRSTAEPGTRVLLRTEMGAGHSGPSGRYDAWRKEAEIFAFLLDAVGLKE